MAPGDDGSGGTAAFYDLRYATTPITTGTWNAATQVAGEPLPLVAGSHQTATVTGLTGLTTYYFALKTSDEVLEHSDGTFWIPMRGFSQSMNISAAASACVTRAISWRMEHLGPDGDLSAEERTALTEQFSFLSVKQRGRVYRDE